MRVPRMVRRGWLPLLVVAAAAGLAACHGGTDRVVNGNTTGDGHDAATDGICEMTTGAGDCSLRAAIDEINNTTTPNLETTINLPTGTYPLTLPGTDDTNAGGDLD